MANDAEEKICLAGQMYNKEEGVNKGAIKFSCDFTRLPGGIYHLGMVAVKDFNRKGWPTSNQQ